MSQSAPQLLALMNDKCPADPLVLSQACPHMFRIYNWI